MKMENTPAEIIYDLKKFNIQQYLVSDSDSNSDSKCEKIQKKKYTQNGAEYWILKYNKANLTTDEYGTYGLCRSIIVRDGKILSFAPPKSVPLDQNPDANMMIDYAEDFIDGTMINLFYDEVKHEWEIATRSTVGANMYFYLDRWNDYSDKHTDMDMDMDMGTKPTTESSMKKKKTFRDMFYEACEVNNINIALLDKTYCYSLVVQHPENRIVVPVDYPKVFLIRAYKIDNEAYTVREVSPSMLMGGPSGFANTSIMYPARYPVDSLENLSGYFNGEQTPYYLVGIMVYSKTGARGKIRNQNYERIRVLRGNQTKLLYHYLDLRKQGDGRVKQFLLFYPEFSRHFVEYRERVHEYTQTLYENYCKCFIKKAQKLKDYPPAYKVQMYKLHEHYLETLKGLGQYVNKRVVIDYFNGLEPAQQMYLLNFKYHTRALENDLEES